MKICIILYLQQISPGVNTFKILALSMTELALLLTWLEVLLFIHYFQITVLAFDRPSPFFDRPSTVIFEGDNWTFTTVLGLLLYLLLNQWPLSIVLFIVSKIKEPE